jgi:hypothetical protein
MCVRPAYAQRSSREENLWSGAVGGVRLALGDPVLRRVLLLTAVAPVTAIAVSGGIVIGVGSGMFAGHVGPLVLTSIPDTHLSRMQALLTLVQSLALVVVATNALGGRADATGAAIATAVCAVAVCAAGAAGLASRPIPRLHQERSASS